MERNLLKEEELKTTVEIPIGYVEGEFEDGRKYVVAFNTKETDEIIGDKVGIVIQGDSLDDAKRKFLISLKCHINWIEKRSHELDLWKPFQKGNWKHVGGTWFKVFGINVYFRYGKGMKGGRYIPFTKLNISINNYWRKSNNAVHA